MKTQEILGIARPPSRLGPPQGNTVSVSDVAGLRSAIEEAAPDTTIVVADGIYEIDAEIVLTQNRVTIRGETSDRERVVLDGMGRFGRILTLKGASDFVIADLTFRNSKQYGLLIYGDSNAQRTRIHNVKFHNIWVRGLKGTHPARIDDRSDNLHPEEKIDSVRPKGGSVRHCLFTNDIVKPYDDDGFDGDYVSGIDMMGLSEWTFADNVFLGIRGKNGGCRGAIFVWVNSDHVTAERNVIIHCDRGIAFGNPSGEPPHMTAGIVRNNVIVGRTNIAIEMSKTVDTKVLHNTVYATKLDYPRTVDFANTTNGVLANNLIHGQVQMDEGASSTNNLVGNYEGWFRDPSIADLRLSDAADLEAVRMPSVPEVTEDYSSRPRHEPATAGAHES